MGNRPRETGARCGFPRRPEPAAHLHRVGLSLATAGFLAAAGCQSPTAPTPDPIPPEASAPVEFITYGGTVFEPFEESPTDMGIAWPDDGGMPIPGALVTIVGGQPDGWTAVTDAEGRYAFENYPKCELRSAECRSRRFRVEKAGYETREVGASDLYRYGGRQRNFSTSEKHFPMSREWPAHPSIQRMLQELPAVRPLFLVERPEYVFGGSCCAFGVVVVKSLENLHFVAHEYCHAHQDWSNNREGHLGDAHLWLRTGEGRAFVAAWEADQPSNDELLRILEIRSRRNRIRNRHEEGANVCALWFTGEDQLYTPFLRDTGPTYTGRTYFREHLPHLAAWAEEWLRWRNWGRRP
ncbi:MAG: carboxypeptidase regulatory-like domain-containing protein [Acidobacteria bacterium]|nr:carboxypeptidase regulatory-like domain-containing protein [Acidobacteriota bacterium]